MKHLEVVVACLLALSLQTGCSDKDTCGPSPSIGDPFDVSADQYSLRYYFIDTSYAALYEPYFQSDPPLLFPESQVVEAEVWIQTQGTSVDPTERFGVAWMDLPPRPPIGYDSTFRSTIDRLGTIERARFYKLRTSSFQLLGDGYLGVIFYDWPVIPDITFGISYRRADGTQYGDLLRNGFEDTTQTPMVFKMVKPRNLFSVGPSYRSAWQMLIKSIYPLGPHHVSRYGFALDLFRNPPNGEITNSLHGYPLLRIMGLDHFLENGAHTSGGDGIFDFRPNFTIRQESGDVMLPSLRPFDTGIITFFWNQFPFSLDSSALYPQLYDTTQSVARQFNTNQYSIRGKAIFD